MSSRAIAVAMMRLRAEAMRAHLLDDPVLTPRHGFAVVRRAGLWCFSSTTFTIGVFNHVSGYGTFAAASPRAIDAVPHHYDRLGRWVHVEVLHPAVTPADRALLVRNGSRTR